MRPIGRSYQEFGFGHAKYKMRVRHLNRDKEERARRYKSRVQERGLGWKQEVGNHQPIGGFKAMRQGEGEIELNKAMSKERKRSCPRIEPGYSAV